MINVVVAMAVLVMSVYVCYVFVFWVVLWVVIFGHGLCVCFYVLLLMLCL